MTEQEFLEELKHLNITLSDVQLLQLKQYYQLLITWNDKINLTRITAKKDVYLKHFYDSLTLAKAVDFKKIENLCDIGTGAGFPGLVLKICFPNIKVTLVDSLQKRINYLNEVIQQLNLEGIIAVHARGEDYAKLNRELYDIVTSRAVAHLRIIGELCIPLVKVGGYFIPMKGNIKEELKESTNTLSKLNTSIENTIEFLLPYEESQRTLLKLKKEKKTDVKYPRSMDKIKKISL